MENKWTETNLSALSSDVSYGYTESATAEVIGPKFLRITDIQNGAVDWRSVPHCPINKKKHEKYKLHQGDIVVARTGNSTGENYLFNSAADAVYASYLIRFQIDQNKADPRFVWYTMRSQEWWAYVQSSKTGSAQAGANAKVLGGFPINLPPLTEQKAIAHILGSLNDKIELNRRMNETLEAMARALFKSWFVDFDPVIDNALAAGNEIPEELKDKAEIRRMKAEENNSSFIPHNSSFHHLFPSEFEHTEEMGWIPKGWGVVTLDDLVDLIGGGTPKTSKEEYWNGGIPWFSVVDAPNTSDVFVIDTEKNVTELGVEKSSTKILPIGTTIISARGTVGKCAMVGESMAMNQSCYGVRGKKDISDSFVYYATREKVADLQRGGHGSVFNTITRDTFKTIKIAFGEPELTGKLDDRIKPSFDRILANRFCSKTLSKTRDTLLPQLLSGEIRIPEAEKLVEDLDRNGGGNGKS